MKSKGQTTKYLATLEQFVFQLRALCISSLATLSYESDFGIVEEQKLQLLQERPTRLVFLALILFVCKSHQGPLWMLRFIYFRLLGFPPRNIETARPLSRRQRSL
jgi:hypothetical protein